MHYAPLLFSLILIFCTPYAHAQAPKKRIAFEKENDETHIKRLMAKQRKCFVIYSEGADIYKEPSKTAKIVEHAACGDEIEALEPNTNAQTNIDLLRKASAYLNNINGFWLKVRYKNQIGYCFNTLLSERRPRNLEDNIVFFHTPAKCLDSAFQNTKAYNWYGLYKKDALRIHIKKFSHISFFTFAENLNKLGVMPYSTTETDDSLYFIIGLRKEKNTIIPGGMLPESNSIGGIPIGKKGRLDSDIDAPERIYLGSTDWSLMLKKTFVKVPSESEQTPASAKLSDWTLSLVRNDFKQKQVLDSGTDPNLAIETEAFTPDFTLDAYGDFDEDGRLDFIISSHNGMRNAVRTQLYLSSGTTLPTLTRHVGSQMENTCFEF